MGLVIKKIEGNYSTLNLIMWLSNLKWKGYRLLVTMILTWVFFTIVKKTLLSQSIVTGAAFTFFAILEAYSTMLLWRPDMNDCRKRNLSFLSKVPEGDNEYHRHGRHLPILHLPHTRGTRGLWDHWQDRQDDPIGKWCLVWFWSKSSMIDARQSAIWYMTEASLTITVTFLLAWNLENLHLLFDIRYYETWCTALPMLSDFATWLFQ